MCFLPDAGSQTLNSFVDLLERQQHDYTSFLSCFGVLLGGPSLYSLFWDQRGRFRSGIGLARLVSEERSGFFVLSVFGRASGWGLLDKVECVNVGLGWDGAVAVQSVSLATHLTRDTRTPTHPPRTLTLSVSVLVKASFCLSFPVCRVLFLPCFCPQSVLSCFCLSSVSLCLSVSVCDCWCPVCVCGELRSSSTH